MRLSSRASPRHRSFVIVDDGEVRFEDAGDLCGQSCRETERLFARKTRQRIFKWRVIGPAGEQQVRFATISHSGRHAGRGGAGAVLGSKNIKAIAVRGTQRSSWAHPQALLETSRSLSEKSMGPATTKYRELGTASNLLLFNRLHALPTRNFQQGSLSEAAELSAEALADARQKTRAYCAACTIGCEHVYAMPGQNDSSTAADGVRIEYQNLFALGPLCGITDQEIVLRASQLCDDLGLDTISAGGTIAFAMECAERNLLDADWLRFGDGDALLRAITLIGNQEDIGISLGQGSRQMAMQLGQETLAFAPQVKGLEIPGYEPRALQTMALGFAVGTRGADHNRSGAYEVDFSGQVNRRQLTPESARLAVQTEDKAALIDSLIFCKFLRGVFADLYSESAEILRLVTGWEVSADELRTTSKRIVSARKLFNIKAGWQPAEDTLPDRMLDQSLADDDASRLRADHLREAIQQYNRHRGWSDSGWPDAAHLETLNLNYPD